MLVFQRNVTQSHNKSPVYINSLPPPRVIVVEAKLPFNYTDDDATIYMNSFELIWDGRESLAMG